MLPLRGKNPIEGTSSFYNYTASAEARMLENFLSFEFEEVYQLLKRFLSETVGLFETIQRCFITGGIRDKILKLGMKKPVSFLIGKTFSNSCTELN